jgi:hypothetical protein
MPQKIREGNLLSLPSSLLNFEVLDKLALVHCLHRHRLPRPDSPFS